ncbi:hypothetical protein J437_LFUL015700 [Ladona fulva]|uniref:DDE-1 domain-containing protein n=1 Tax=Ladona fulva TaxID=123851 RepID=A0A8K0KGY0_LADFU|nr:hypothetical protein J437_LFUL015700 [Ladona fulva]
MPSLFGGKCRWDVCHPQTGERQENPLLMDDNLPWSFACYNKSGWINKESFVVWFKKFIEFSNPLPNKLVLLILDGHESHTKTLELIQIARDKNVMLARQWLIAHPGRAVTINQVGKLMDGAFTRAALMQTAIKGFFKTGICPLDRNIFPDHMYAPSDTTDRPEAASEPQPSTCGSILQQGAAESQPSTSGNASGFFSPSSEERSTFTISPKILMHPLKEVERTQKKKSCRKKGKTVILTSSPNKKELEIEMEKKEGSKKAKEARKESQNKKLPERKTT